mgnify:CR=1 FL=1
MEGYDDLLLDNLEGGIRVESRSSRRVIKMMKQDFAKLYCLDEIATNFTRWKDKMIFFLTILKVAYVLYPNLSEISPPRDDDSKVLKRQREKREENEVVCRGHILKCFVR